MSHRKLVLRSAPLVLSPASRIQRRRILTGAVLSLTALTVSAAALSSSCTLCYAVSTGERPLAYVQRQETCALAAEQVEAQVSEILETNYTYPRGIQISRAIAPKDAVQSAGELTGLLLETVDQIQLGYVLSVDGSPVGACSSREAIQAALDQAEASYTNENTVSVRLDSALEISSRYLPAGMTLLAPESLAQRLTQFSEAAHTALLAVETVEETTALYPLEAPIMEQEDPSLPVGKRVIVQDGASGTEARTERVYLRCGLEEDRELLSIETITEPIPTIVAVGSAQDDGSAEDSFFWPCMGTITSAFGNRHIFGGEDFHRGLDISVPLGTEISAAAGGVVIWAGEKGSYGNLVQIDHGNGFVTYYAHCSQLLVEYLDEVAQGQVIALAGSTGRSTGPHCHFEVRWQGTPQNPQDYLP